jgi:hypothetical protein
VKHGQATLGHPPTETPAPAGSTLSVYVLATTEAGTRTALATAGAFARDLHARIVVLVPHVVPYAQTLEHPADPAAFAGERYRQAADALGLDVTIQVCLCRSVDAVTALLPRDAAVLVGGRARRRFQPWPTREERLARALERGGRRVLFIC